MAKKQRPSSSSSSSSQLWTIHLLLVFLVIRHAGAQPAMASPPRNGFNGSNLNPPSLAIIIVIVVTAFFFMGFFTIYIHQCAGGGSSTTSRSHRRCGLDPEIIDTFPTFLYSYVKDLKIGKGALECAVCLSEFEDEVTLRWLPKCDHVFHPDCIDSWLASHSTCPLCRSDLSATPTRTTPIFSNNEQEVDADQFQNTSQSPSSLTEINNNLVNETAENSGRVRGRFRRWHTTGHTSSVVVVVVEEEEGCDDCERFTLRLPEEVRRQIVESTAEAARMKRAKSCVDERGRGEGSVSSRRWWGRGEDREKWLFFSRGPSVKSPKITDGEGSASASARGNSTRSFVTSVTAPFDCIGSRAEVEEATATTPNTDRLPV